jgi:hypothetical protein
MGVNTGTIIHSCSFRVPSSVPLGSYCLRVIANGISSACKTVSVTNKLFKELKYEIKEKLEILENLKQIRDVNVKRLPDIDDLKLIREDLDLGLLDRIQEEWVKNVRTLAEGVDQSNAQLSRTFIVPEEADVGSPPPQIEELKGPAFRRRGQDRPEKRAFNDGRKELAAREAEEFHNLIHSFRLRRPTSPGRPWGRRRSEGRSTAAKKAKSSRKR